MRYVLTMTIISGCLTACSSGDRVNDPMRAEFLEHCQTRPEYKARKRAGTLDKYCLCVFDKTMKDLTEEERIVAGFYLYGESSDDYLNRYPIEVNKAGNIMATASQAIDKAVKSCR